MFLSRPARSAPTWVSISLALLLLPSVARAQLPPDPTGTGNAGAAGLTKADFLFTLYQQVGDEWREFNQTEADTFFNRARCLCNQPVRVRVTLTQQGIIKARMITRGDVALWAGDQTCVCTGATCANKHCNQIDTTRDLNALVTGGVTFDTTARAIFQGGQTITGPEDLGPCNRDEMQNLWVLMDVANDASADTVLTDVNTAIRLDGVPPASPLGLRVTPGNEALEVNWEQLPYLDDLQGYIVFCARNGDIPVFPGAFTPQYSTTTSVCGVPAPQPLTADVDGGGRGVAPERIRVLEPLYACSDIITSATTSTRLYQLQNGIPYVVGVASVDKRGNASPIEEVIVQAPIPTRDFYRSYREAGGTAEGGFCALAAPGSSSGRALALLLVLPGLVLLVRRRRR
jgi:hypothetical protein